MKKSILLITILLSALTFQSCAEMAAGLSNFNQANGSQCRRIVCDSEIYAEGKYQDMIAVKDSKGNDIESKERSWVNAQTEKYLHYSFGNYYATSPYSNHEYRFTNYCASYY